MLSSPVSRDVLPLIFRECMLKRTMATIIDRTDMFGGPYRVGGDIAPYFIHTIEAALPREEQRDYNTIHGGLVGRLFRADTGTKKTDQTDSGGRALNMAVLRRLGHASFSPALEAVSTALPEKADNVDTLRKVIMQQDEGLRWLMDNITADPYAIPGMITAPDRIAEYLANRSAKLSVLAALLRIHCIFRGGEHRSYPWTDLIHGWNR